MFPSRPHRYSLSDDPEHIIYSTSSHAPKSDARHHHQVPFRVDASDPSIGGNKSGQDTFPEAEKIEI